MEYPRKWRHKETKKELRVMPWWEIPESILSEKEAPNVAPDRMYKIGALVQVGWLLENEHGVWLGVGPKAADSFEDMGMIQNEKTKETVPV